MSWFYSYGLTDTHRSLRLLKFVINAASSYRTTTAHASSVHRYQLIFLSLYATPQTLFLSYLPWNLLRTLTRLMRLDATMLMAFLQLMRMGRTVSALRTRIETEQSFKSIERILEDVDGRA